MKTDKRDALALAEAILSREGLRVPTGSSACFGERVQRLELAQPLSAEFAPLLAMLRPLNERIRLLDVCPRA